MKNLAIWMGFMLALTTLAACGRPAGSIAIRDAWVRPALTPDGTTAAYMLIHNSGGADDQLVSAAGDEVKSIELHETMQMNGMMEMEGRRALIVPANGQLELKPGGAHMMLFGVSRSLKPGDRVTLTLQFERAKAITVSAEVRDPLQ